MGRGQVQTQGPPDCSRFQAPVRNHSPSSGSQSPCLKPCGELSCSSCTGEEDNLISCGGKKKKKKKAISGHHQSLCDNPLSTKRLTRTLSHQNSREPQKKGRSVFSLALRPPGVLKWLVLSLTRDTSERVSGMETRKPVYQLASSRSRIPCLLCPLRAPWRPANPADKFSTIW